MQSIRWTGFWGLILRIEMEPLIALILLIFSEYINELKNFERADLIHPLW